MPQRKRIGLYLMSLLYVLAGANHFIDPGFYKKMMPAWVPYHDAMITISGGAEILLGVLLLFAPMRRRAAWGIIILLIAVFPANVQMMLNYYHAHHPYLWITILRLPLQLVLIAWAWQYAKKES